MISLFFLRRWTWPLPMHGVSKDPMITVSKNHKTIINRLSLSTVSRSEPVAIGWPVLMSYARHRLNRARSKIYRSHEFRGSRGFSAHALRPIAFTILVVTGSFGVAIYKDRLDYKKQIAMEEKNSKPFEFLKRSIANSPFRTHDQRVSHQGEVSVVDLLLNLKNMYWDTRTSSYKLCLQIALLNFTVYCAWKVPALQPTMSKHFLHVPASNRLHTLVSSVFSHKTFLHYVANTYVMMQFGPIFGHLLCPTSEAYLMAYFVSTGTISSLAQHLFSRTALGASSINIGSLGSSGAVWAMISGLAYFEPHARISAIFLPDLEFELWVGCLILAAVDVVGIFRKNTPFSHSAHLGGAASGVLVTYVSQKFPRVSKRPPTPKLAVATYSGVTRNPWF